jgi:hypothetical protein
MGTNFTDIATTDPVIAATINDRLDQLDAAILAGLGGSTLTNKSGGSLAANDCVVVSTANNEAVTTSTSGGDINRPGIILSGGAADAEVTVTFLGEATVVVDGAGTRGQWIKSSTVAKRVTPTSTLDVGVFGILTSNSSGGAGTTATAVLLGAVITAPGTHTHAATDIVSGILALARGGTGASLAATGPGYLKQTSLGAVVTVAAILAADLPAATESAQGAVELATTAEAAAGADTTRAITAAGLLAAAWLRSQYINTSAGAGDAGKPILLDAAGKIAASMLAAGYIDHNQLLNLASGDPHTQYIAKATLTTKGDLLARDASSPARLAAGASGQVLSVDPTEPTGLKWIPPVSSGSGIPTSLIDAKGDLVVGTADDTAARLPVGSNGQVLMADSSQAAGLVWANLLQDNIFINGGFDIWQRTPDDSGVTTTRKYVADRWAVTCGAGTLAHVQRSTTVRSGARSKYSLQLDGAGGVTTVDVDQRIEATQTGLYKRQIYFTAYVYNGSGTAFTPTLFVSTPSAADNWSSSTVRNGGGSGEALQECADSAWTLVVWTADISAYTNIDNGVEFRLRIPSGSLVAGDVVRLAEINLVPGGVATPFVARPIGLELMLCQRYYWKSFPLDVPPAQATGDPTGVIVAFGAAAVAYSTAGWVDFPVPMRATPTVTTYNPYQANANWRDVGNTVDKTVATGTTSYRSISLTMSDAPAAGGIYAIHATASAEL